MEIKIGAAKADVEAAKKLYPGSHIRQVGLSNAITILERVEKVVTLCGKSNGCPFPKERDCIACEAITNYLRTGEEW